MAVFAGGFLEQPRGFIRKGAKVRKIGRGKGRGMGYFSRQPSTPRKTVGKGY